MITITDTATIQIKKILSKYEDAYGIQVGVKTTGCSGLAYTIVVCDPITTGWTEDNVFMTRFERNGIWLYVDSKSEPYLKGTEIDFVVKDKFTSGFQFNNPNERDRCGCGESFRV